MRIDPLVSLTFSVQTNKGVYALLLGSGISRAAGIPTGWEIVLDLIRKLAAVQCEEPLPGAEEWFKERYGKPADYADLLDQLTQTAAERTELLRSYFEPNEQEREQGLKFPTAAHRAIAELMRLGYFRIVITTNFDRLLEQALKDAGLEPVVISTSDAIKGAPPLAHARCTIVKLHGDYLDHRLKNTPKELARYEKSMDQLLDRILEEFGLIVCGWSAQYDTALRAAIERCPNRRYPTYWADRGDLSEIAQNLIALRDGKTVSVSSADELFGGLRDNIVALERFQISDPVSEKVAIARTKKYLAASEYRIDFHDLMHRETERVVEAAFGSEFPVQGVQLSPALLEARLTAFENTCSTLMSIAATAAYWSRPEHYSAILSCLRRLIEDPELQSGLTILIDLRRYPALLFTYVVGLAAIASENYDLLVRKFHERVRLERHREMGPLISSFYQDKVLNHSAQKAIPGREREATPLSNRLYERLRPYLREYLPSEPTWEVRFDWFEYLFGLMHCYHSQDWALVEQRISEGNNAGVRGWGPIGCFGWRHCEDPNWIVNEMKVQNGILPPDLANLMRAVLPGDDPAAQQRFLLAKDTFDNFVARVASNWW